MEKPWFKYPAPIARGAHIAIIGGGIGGVSTYYHLTNAGFEVTLFDREERLLAGASGNPAAILDPFISLGETIEKSFFALCYTYALEFYRSFGGDVLVPKKLLKCPADSKERQRFEAIAQNYDNDFVYFDEGNLVFPTSGYIRPASLRKKITNSKSMFLSQDIRHIAQNEDQSWSIYTDENETLLTADAIVLCTSYKTDKFKYTNHVNLEQVAGQVTLIKPDLNVHNIICSKGYVTPAVKTELGTAHVCGATFEKNTLLPPSIEADRENLRNSPYRFESPDIIGNRRAIRAMSNDHLPLSGPAPNEKKYRQAYGQLHHGPRHKTFDDAPYHKNLFLNVGLGARGFLSAPLLGKYVADLISGSPAPLDKKISHALHPARFIIRELSKK